MCLSIDEVGYMFSYLYVLIVIVLLMFILFIANIFIIEKGLLNDIREENTSYECGFEHNSLSRVPFSIRYFMLTVVFLVFDVEVVLMLFLPYSLLTYVSTSFLVIIVLFFAVVLVLGLFYEWFDGSLEWII